MKKINLLLVVLISFMALTSCMEGGSNTTSGSAIGVLTISSKNFNYMLNSTAGPVSSPQLATLMGSGQIELDGCYGFSFEYSGNLPENSYAQTEANGYSTVTINEIEEISRYNAESYLTDTATVITGEVPVADGSYSEQYIENYLVLQQIVNQPSDMQLYWNMSYDQYSLMNPVEEGGIRYYDLFIRATVKSEGTKSAGDIAYLNAYHIGNYMTYAAQTEKNKLGSSYTSMSVFKVRINYANEIKDGKISWKNKVIQPYIGSFVGE